MAEFYVKDWMTEEPDKEIIDWALKDIAFNTRNGDFGSYTPSMIDKVVFWKEGDEWVYGWEPKPEFHKPIERIRRVTGYLVGTLDRFNDGKRAEERDRVKHGLNQDAENRNVILNRERHNCSLNDK